MSKDPYLPCPHGKAEEMRKRKDGRCLEEVSSLAEAGGWTMDDVVMEAGIRRVQVCESAVLGRKVSVV